MTHKSAPLSAPPSAPPSATHSAHLDTYTRDHLPPPDQLPAMIFEGAALQFAPQMNCATELLDHWVAAGEGARRCVIGQHLGLDICWSYAELQAQANRIANLLVQELRLVPGQRVLLRGANTPMLAACWFAVVKAGGVAVGTMPLLRAGELAVIIDKAQISHALCDARLLDELNQARQVSPVLQQLLVFNDEGAGSVEARGVEHSAQFDSVATAADDTCVIAFTSGTTGVPKATMHFHRDLIAACRCWPVHVLRARADDVFIGSPPLAFTFGLGGLLLFPLSIGAASVLVEKTSPEALLQAIARTRATVLFTAPTSYRALAVLAAQHDISSLRKCVSAGEALPAATRRLWKEASGVEIIDGIGSTEMFHIFISANEQDARPGTTGLPVPGYRATVLDDAGHELPRGQIGRLAVQGPTGCKYLADERQKDYVQGGWNITGDTYLIDGDGQFVYQARSDDMIITGGYNIAGPEVENALLLHPAVAECAVIGQADEARGMIVKALVVLRPGHVGDAQMVQTLQDHVKASIAPYKYPRIVVFRDHLPRTETGKLQRFRLRQER